MAMNTVIHARSTTATKTDGSRAIEEILSTGKALHVLEQAPVNPPQFQGLDIAYTSGTAAATYVIATNMQIYHMGELVITVTGADTLEIRGRHADGTTSGILDAIGPTGAVVVLNATQLVAANNGRYRIPRFDIVDLIGVKVGAAGVFTVTGRVASA